MDAKKSEAGAIRQFSRTFSNNNLPGEENTRSSTAHQALKVAVNGFIVFLVNWINIDFCCLI